MTDILQNMVFAWFGAALAEDCICQDLLLDAIKPDRFDVGVFYWK